MIELVLIGKLNSDYLKILVKKVEKEIKRRIVVREYDKLTETINGERKLATYLLLWNKEID